MSRLVVDVLRVNFATPKTVLRGNCIIRGILARIIRH